MLSFRQVLCCTPIPQYYYCIAARPVCFYLYVSRETLHASNRGDDLDHLDNMYHVDNVADLENLEIF